MIKANVKAVGLPGATVAVDRVERLLARPPAAKTKTKTKTKTALTWSLPIRPTRSPMTR